MPRTEVSERSRRRCFRAWSTTVPEGLDARRRSARWLDEGSRSRLEPRCSASNRSIRNRIVAAGGRDRPSSSPAEILRRAAFSFWIETLGCPKNQVDSDKLTGKMLADGLRPRPSADSADVVVVNTCAFIEEARQESIDTILALSGQPASRGPPRRDRLHGRALRQRTCRSAARGRPGGGLRRSGVDRPKRTRAPNLARAIFDLLEPASTQVDLAVGLREDRRRVRSQLWLLCDSIVSRPAAKPIDRVDTGRGRRTRAHERSCWSRKTWRATAKTIQRLGAGVDRGARSTLSASVTDWVRLLYLYPSDLTDELIDADRSSRVSPTSICRLQHVPQAVAAPHAALGRRRTIPGPDRTTSDRVYPGRGVPIELHRRISGRNRRRPRRSCSRSSKSAQLDWCGFFAVQPRRRHLRRQRSTGTSPAD